MSSRERADQVPLKHLGSEELVIASVLEIRYLGMFIAVEQEPGERKCLKYRKKDG